MIATILGLVGVVGAFSNYDESSCLGVKLLRGLAVYIIIMVMVF